MKMPVLQKKSNVPKIFFLFVFFSINPCWAIPKTKPVAQAAKEIKVMIGLQNLKDANRRIGTVLSKYSQLLLQSIQPIFSGKKMALLLEAEALARRDVIPLEKALADLELATKMEQKLEQPFAKASVPKQKQLRPALIRARAETTLARIRVVRAEVEKYGLEVVKQKAEAAARVFKDLEISTNKRLYTSDHPEMKFAFDKLCIIRNMDDIASGKLAQQIQKAGGIKQAIQEAEKVMKNLSDQMPSVEEAWRLAQESNDSEKIKKAFKKWIDVADAFDEAVRNVRLLQSEEAFLAAH